MEYIRVIHTARMSIVVRGVLTDESDASAQASDQRHAFSEIGANNTVGLSSEKHETLWFTLFTLCIKHTEITLVMISIIPSACTALWSCPGARGSSRPRFSLVPLLSYNWVHPLAPILIQAQNPNWPATRSLPMASSPLGHRHWLPRHAATPHRGRP